ncbi:hypothetical protein BVY02_01380 [bacterium J17]|nr:hypothetical protein BVY02_01380 [bacterium J17]
MFELLRFVPKAYLSFLVGVLVRIHLPRALNVRLINWFAKRYRVNLDEMANQVEDYRCLADFFTRDLKANARPIGEGLVSPVDGRIDAFGCIEDGKLVQVKGKSYSMHSLLLHRELTDDFNSGFFIHIYLAPGDYHHLHSPVDGEM